MLACSLTHFLTLLTCKAAVPWEDEIAFEVLGPLQFPAVGAFGETAFVHRASGTLLVTDMIIKVEEVQHHPYMHAEPDLPTYSHTHARTSSCPVGTSLPYLLTYLPM